MYKAEHAMEIMAEKRAALIVQGTTELLRDLEAIEDRIDRLELALRSLAYRSGRG